MYSFTKQLGTDELDIVNLFAYRSTDPKELYVKDNPIGVENDTFIIESIKTSKFVIVGWGNHGKLHNRSSEVVTTLLKQYKNRIFALRILKNGEPGHPLYIPYSSKLKRFIN